VRSEVPTFKSYFSTNKISLEALRKNNRNLLFRPIGLILLSQLYVWFSGKGRLSDLAKGLGMLKFDSPGGVFDNVLWSKGKIEARAPNRTAAANLCSYLLNLDIESPGVLRERLATVTKNNSYKLPKRILG